MIVSSLRLGAEYVLGVGLGLSPIYLATQKLGEDTIYGADYPHNFFMQLTAETGIVGLLIFLLFLYVSFRPLLLKRAHAKSVPFYVAALLFFSASMFYPLTFDALEILSFGLLYLGVALSDL
jgi:O-antigen ligase